MAQVSHAPSGHDEILSMGVGALTSLAAREAQSMREDHRLHSMFKSELDLLEDKLSRQMASFRGQLMRQGERLTEAFLNPLEAKVTAIEGRERKIDCQLSDLSGSVKGLIEEVQMQVRRADKADAKFRHWRKLSEETYAKLEDQINTRQPPLGLLGGLNGLVSGSLSPRAEYAQTSTPEAASDSISRQELASIVESLRRDLNLEIRTVVDQRIKDHLENHEAAPSPDISEGFAILRQDQEMLAMEIARQTKEVRIDQDGLKKRVEDLSQEFRLVKASSAASPATSQAPAEKSVIALETQLKQQLDVFDEKISRALSAPSMKDLDSITERLARLAGRVADMEQEGKSQIQKLPSQQLAVSSMSNQTVSLLDSVTDHVAQLATRIADLEHKERETAERISTLSCEIPDRVMALHGSPAPAVPRLDLSQMQAGSPITPAQLAAWADCGTSPGLSSLPGTNVEAITSVVEDAVWNKVKGHLFKMVRSQEDMVEQLGNLADRKVADDPDIMRLYKTLSDVVEIVTGIESGDAVNVAANAEKGKPIPPEGEQLIHLWRDELMKLWRVLFEHVEHLELLLGGEIDEPSQPKVEAPLSLASQPEPERPPEPLTIMSSAVAVARSTLEDIAPPARKAPETTESMEMVPPPPSETLPLTREAPETTESMVPCSGDVLDIAVENTDVSDLACSITQADVDEQWRLLRESSEALITRKGELDRSLAEVRALAEAHRRQESEESMNVA